MLNHLLFFYFQTEKTSLFCARKYVTVLSASPKKSILVPQEINEPPHKKTNILVSACSDTATATRDG